MQCEALCEDETYLCLYTGIWSDFNTSENLKEGTKYKEKEKETYKPQKQNALPFLIQSSSNSTVLFLISYAQNYGEGKEIQDRVRNH